MVRIIDKERFITCIIILVILVGLPVAIGTIERRHELQQESVMSETGYILEKPGQIKQIAEDEPDARVLPPTKQQILSYLRQKCFEEQVDYEEALGIMITENEDLNTEAVHYNKDGTMDSGLFQINTRKFEDYKDKLHITNVFDYKQNIDVGVRIISELQKYPEHKRYMAYNLGEGGMKKLASRGIDSTRYSRKVAAAVSRIGSGAGHYD